MCRLELTGVHGVRLELVSRTLYCADGSVLVGEFLYDPRRERMRVLRAEVEYRP